MEKLNGIIIVYLMQICYGVLAPLNKKNTQSFPPFTVMAVSMFALFILAVVCCLIFEKSWQLDFVKNRQGLILLLFTGTVNFVGFTLLLSAYKYFPVWQIVVLMMSQPLITSVIAFLILREPLTWKFFLSLLFMAIGNFIATR